jgi:Extracellular link domain
MSAPVSSPPPSLPTLTLPPNESVMNMKVGDIVKAIMSALQQASKSIQSAAQSEPDPTAKAALAGVANTISPSSTTTTTTNNVMSGASIPPTTITISQAGASTSATLPGAVPSIPLPSTTYMTPQPTVPTPTPAPTPTTTTSTADALMNLRHTKRPLLPTIVTLIIVCVLGVVAIFLALSDTVAFLAFVALVAFIGFILYSYGFVQIKKTDTELDITYDLNPFEDSTSTKATTMTPSPVILPPSTEVFYVSDNTFTYSQAPAVCKAYGATLASYSQVEEAYRQGAEWCGYGWSEGGIALFPTQQATWEKLQKEQDSQARIKCGRPGVNGGYFDPSTQFGVNCYGVRPAKKASDTAPPTTSPDMTDRLVAQFQQNLAKYVVSPFNQKVWSEVSGNPQDIQLSQTPTPSAATVPGATQPVVSTSPSTPTSTTKTETDTLLAALHSIPSPPIAPPANVKSVLAQIEELGSAPMGLLRDSYDELTEFVHEIV